MAPGLRLYDTPGCFIAAMKPWRSVFGGKGGSRLRQTYASSHHIVPRKYVVETPRTTRVAYNSNNRRGAQLAVGLQAFEVHSPHYAWQFQQGCPRGPRWQPVGRWMIHACCGRTVLAARGSLDDTCLLWPYSTCNDWLALVATPCAGGLRSCVVAAITLLPNSHKCTADHHVDRQNNLVRALLAVGCTRRMSRGLLQSCWIPFFNVGGAHATACGGTVR